MRAFVTLVLALAVAGCSKGSGSSSEACAELVDGYARSWQRCGRDTYDSAKQTFSDAFNCSAAKSFDQQKVNACLADLESESCTAVKSGTSPASCTNALK